MVTCKLQHQMTKHTGHTFQARCWHSEMHGRNVACICKCGLSCAWIYSYNWDANASHAHICLARSSLSFWNWRHCCYYCYYCCVCHLSPCFMVVDGTGQSRASCPSTAATTELLCLSPIRTFLIASLLTTQQHPHAEAAHPSIHKVHHNNHCTLEFIAI